MTQPSRLRTMNVAISVRTVPFSCLVEIAKGLVNSETLLQASANMHSTMPNG